MGHSTRSQPPGWLRFRRSFISSRETQLGERLSVPMGLAKKGTCRIRMVQNMLWARISSAAKYRKGMAEKSSSLR